MAKPKLLLVDDDPLISETLGFVLAEDFEVATAQTRDEARACVAKSARAFAVALIDLGLPPQPHTAEEGFALVRELMANDSNLKILILSGQSDKRNIQHAMTLGAVDFIPKPCDPGLLKTRLEHQLLLREVEEDPVPRGQVSELIGNSQAMADLAVHIRQYADSPFSVLIEGESGCGKELIAKQLHEQGVRTGAPYYVINCAAFTKELLEAQLFGHAKGAFTGANKDHSGFFEAVGEGTLFMDEVGELPLELQAKLLRVLESGEFYRLGETKPRMSQARIVAATNKNMRREVAENRFRQDLYHRLGILTLRVPPLRERDDDRNQLLAHFQDQLSGTVPSFSLGKEAKALWQGYRFPGNIRELRNLVIRLGTKYPNAEISAEQLMGEIEPDDYGSDESQGAGFDPSADLLSGDFDLDSQLRAFEKQYIEAAIAQSGGNFSKVAKLLNMNRTTLYSRMERLGLKD
ncbi:Two Component Transcriptional Regulator, Fis family [gamma proteobacterium HTCC5015]|nr:Two Component Transcriptional Regulator, Fis family [gamma proteobacterium HTCC5015]